MTVQLRARATATVTDTGRLRRRNEDRTLSNGRVFAVADGMGGNTIGDQAAEAVVDSLDLNISELPIEASHQETITAIKTALEIAAEKICVLIDGEVTSTTDTAIENQPAAAGSTVAGLVLADVPFAFHVGDSRVYRYRPETAELARITRDHSIVQRLVDTGELTDNEARQHPRRNVITRAIGTFGVPEVEITRMDLNYGDVVLICSDGLSDEISDPEISQVIADTLEDGIEAVAYALRDVAICAGGRDNVSLVLIEVGE